MNPTLKYLQDKYQLAFDEAVVEIPNITRETLANIFCELDFRVGAEIGVEKGDYSKVLCEANPNLKLYCIDPWTLYAGYRDSVEQDLINTFYQTATKNLTDYNVEILKDYSANAVVNFEDESLDFVYIDANHAFNYVYQDISLWAPKVRIGGIISGHDYIHPSGVRGAGVIEAVNQYVQDHNIRPLLLVGTKAKLKGQLRDSSRSWMWVKTV